jgi:iron(III) transport system permease protein
VSGTLKRRTAPHPAWTWFWLSTAWLSTLVLPWYGFDGKPTDATGAVKLGIGAEPWLLALLAFPLLATLATMIRRPVWLAVGCVLGLICLSVNAVVIAHIGAAHAPFGWGSLGYGVAAAMVISIAMARRGWGKGDAFTVGALVTVSGAILVFVGYPVACILISAFKDNAGALALGGFADKITARSIWGLACLTGGRNCGVAWNSLGLAVLVGAVSTLLGLAFALVSARTRFPFPRLLRIMSILPIITPPFVIGLALILLFGRAGLVTTWLSQWFAIERSRWF